MKWIAPILVFILIMTVIGISGCTNSNSNNTTQQSNNINNDFYIDGVPLIEQATTDEYGNIIGGDYAGEWHVMITVRSKSEKAYNNIIANVTAYDKNNKIIYNKINKIPYLPKSLGENIDFYTGKKQPDHVTMVIMNATSES